MFVFYISLPGLVDAWLTYPHLHTVKAGASFATHSAHSNCTWQLYSSVPVHSKAARIGGRLLWQTITGHLVSVLYSVYCLHTLLPQGACLLCLACLLHEQRPSTPFLCIPFMSWAL